MNKIIFLSLVVLLVLSESDAVVIEVPLACEGRYAPGQSWATNFDIGFTFTEITNVYIEWSGTITAEEVCPCADPCTTLPVDGKFVVRLRKLNYYYEISHAYTRAGATTYPATEPFELQLELPELNYEPGVLFVCFEDTTLSNAERNALLASLGGGTVKTTYIIAPCLSFVELPKGVTVQEALAALENAPGILSASPSSSIPRAPSAFLDGHGIIEIFFGKLYRSLDLCTVEYPSGQILSATLIVEGIVASEHVTRLVPQEYLTIQSAIDAANDGDTVVVADGIYTGKGNRDIDFKCKSIIVRSENGPQNCIIDCQKSGRGFHFHSGEHYNSILDGFTITNGYGDYGGGIYCESSHPTITNCTFRDNTAQYWGISSALTPHENNSLMVNNDGEVHINAPPGPPVWRGYGGGIYCRLSSPTLTKCKFIGNSVNDYGGGMYGYKSSPILTNCTFSSNSSLFGGAMSNSRGSPILKNCTFVSNWASYGGAIHNSTSNPSLFSCIFNGNSAERRGGCMYNLVSNPMLTNCTFNKNSARYDGGVIYNRGSDATLSNCILWSNTAARGNEISLINYIEIGGSEIPSTINVDYSDVEGGAAGVYVDINCTLNWGEGNIDADPCFVSPGLWDSNGIWVDGDYHLLPDSPCIDAGDPNYVPEPNETDLDGRPRVIGSRIDMGAYEYSAPIPAEVRIVPRTINLQSKGEWITGFIQMPEDYDMNDVDANSILLEGEIKPERFWFAEDNQIAIARFSREELRSIISTGEVEITITGQLSDGTLFEGTDIIKVIDEGRKKN